MKTPLETAQKILKGCFIQTGLDLGGYICKRNQLCPICKATLQAKKEEWQMFIQEEIEDNDFLYELEGYISTQSGEYLEKLYKKLEEYNIKRQHKIENLKKAVELANG